MEWNYNETENQYELYQDGQKSVIFPDKIASEVEAIFPGLGRVAITQVTEDESQDSLSKTKDDAEPIVGLSRTDMPDIPSGSNLKTNAIIRLLSRLVTGVQFERMVGSLACGLMLWLKRWDTNPVVELTVPLC
jgi:hypothetical protein